MAYFGYRSIGHGRIFNGTGTYSILTWKSKLQKQNAQYIAEALFFKKLFFYIHRESVLPVVVPRWWTFRCLWFHSLCSSEFSQHSTISMWRVSHWLGRRFRPPSSTPCCEFWWRWPFPGNEHLPPRALAPFPVQRPSVEVRPWEGPVALVSCPSQPSVHHLTPLCWDAFQVVPSLKTARAAETARGGARWTTSTWRGSTAPSAARAGTEETACVSRPRDGSPLGGVLLAKPSLPQTEV